MHQSRSMFAVAGPSNHVFFMTPLAVLVRAAVLGLGLALAQVPAALAETPQQAAPQRSYNIPAGPLGDSLNRFASEAGITLSYRPGLVVGKQSPGVTGTLAPEAALAELLTGSGLTYHFAADGTVTLAASASNEASVADSAPIELGVISIEGRRFTDRAVGREQSFNALGEREVLNTPFSVTSYTEELIEATNASSLRDVLSRDASVSSEDQEGGFLDEFTIRGFSVGRGAFIYDGLQNLLPIQGFVNTNHISRIEVFRGANAIIAGASATNRSGPGGAFNIVPKRPDEEPITEVTAGYLSDSTYIASLDLSRRFGPDEQFGARLALSTQDGELAIDDIDRENDLFSLYLNWRPNDRLSLNSQIARIKDQTFGYQDNFAVAPGARLPSSVPDPSRNYGQSWTEVEQATGWLYTLQGEYALSDNFSLSAGYGRYNTDNDNRYVAYFCTVLNSAGDLECEIDSGQVLTDNESFNVSGQGSYQLAGLDMSTYIGYSRSKVDNEFRALFFEGELLSNMFDPVRLPAPDIPDEPNFVGGGPTTVETTLFKQEVLALDERLSVIGGFSAVDIENNNFNNYKDSAVAPFGTLAFKPTENSSVYIGYTEGLEVGGTAPNDAANANETLPPVTSQQFEIGAKLELGDVLLTAAAFEIERELEFVNEDNFFVQEGLQVHRGIELQASGQVTEALEIIGGITYLDAEIEDNGDPNVSGNRPVGVPEWSVAAFANYEVPGIAGLSVTGGVRYETGQFVDLENTQEVDSFWVADAGITQRFDIGNTDLTARLFVNNVFDEEYFEASNTRGLVISSPRTFRLTVSAEF